MWLLPEVATAEVDVVVAIVVIVADFRVQLKDP